MVIMGLEFLWYVPNTVQAGHRGDDLATGWADLGQSTELARIVEDHGWGRDFMQLVRQLWTEENVTYRGEYFAVEGSTVTPYKREAARVGDELLHRLL
jgi:hypothetical protein